MAKQHDILRPVRAEVRGWLQRVLKETGWSADRWARAAATSATNITRPLHSEHAALPSLRTIAALESVLPPGLRWRAVAGRDLAASPAAEAEVPIDPTIHHINFAEALKFARTRAPAEAAQAIAEKAGIPLARYERLERAEGEPTLEELVHLARALETSLDFLVLGALPPSAPTPDETLRRGPQTIHEGEDSEREDDWS